LPDVAVGISKVTVIHKTKILNGIDICGSAICGSRLVHGVDGLATVARQGQHHFAGCRWWHWTIGKSAPLGMREKHDIDRLAPYHASSRIVSEMRVILKTDGLVERHRCVEVNYGQVHENHSGHCSLPPGC